MAFILSTGNQRAAKTSRVTVGGPQGTGSVLTFASYNVDVKGEDLNTTNFQSYNAGLGESFDEGIMGILGASLKFGGAWDAGFNPFDSPPGLYPRDNLANLYFYPSQLDGIPWWFPYARLRDASNSGEVRGLVMFSCGGQNQGKFIYPSGSVTNR